MKTTLSIIMVAALNFGCTTNREQNCATWQNIYTTYLVTAQVREVSEDEQKVAADAALALTLYCGWTNITPVASISVPLAMPPK